jgi:hypothetical protein
MACGPCKKQNLPGTKGRTCLLNIEKGVTLQDYKRQEHSIKSFEELYRLYELWEAQRIERAKEKLAGIGGAVPEMEPDDFTDWLIKRGICPHALVSTNSRYHFENVVLLDSDMGLRLPDQSVSISDTPAIFFQALGIVRSARAKVRQEESGKNNSD